MVTAAALLMAYSLAFSHGRRTVPAVVAGGAEVLTELERRRLRAFLGEDLPVQYGPLRAPAYLVLRVPVGLLGGVILLLVAYGAAVAVRLAAGACWPSSGIWGPEPSAQKTN
ncbi:hypothetical protein [Actinomadura chokoriensis]|uniref:Uncharacterized protein n=1 Tax=Actinomadura chokoriensis TaxID=454156 RepID=A0ABV4QYD6_9ACTN